MLILVLYSVGSVAIGATPGAVKNVRFQNVGHGIVIVDYDLEAEKSVPYNVAFHVAFGQDSGNQEFRPKHVTGDVNQAISPGPRRIVWDAQREYNGAIPVNDAILRITATPKLSKWWYIGGSAVIAGGATALVLALLPKEEKNGQLRIVVPSLR